MIALEIRWESPWRAVQGTAHWVRIQQRLDKEINPQHPLHGKGATVVGRRVDCDEVLARLADGSYVNVHLVWGATESQSGTYPRWFAYGSLESFVQAMQNDAEGHNG